MTNRILLHIILLCLLVLPGRAQNYTEMVADMNDKSLPLVNVEVDIDSVSSEYFLPGTITINEYKDNTVTTDTYNCQVRHRGMLALILPKKSFTIKLVDDEGEKLDANLLNLRTDNIWILDAMGYDKLRMRNRLCFDIWNEYSQAMWDTKYGKRNGTVGTMVEVFINGEYNGIYCLSDKINRQLLNLRKAKVNDNGLVTVKGLLYKGINNFTSNHLDTYIEDNTDSIEWNSFELQYPDEYPSQQAWQPLMNLIDFNSQTTDDYFIEHYDEWYYVDNLVDYWILLVAFGIKDMPYKNTFLSTPDINFEHRFMITPWDMDACMGRNWIGLSYPEPSTLERLDDFAPFSRFLALDIDGFKNKLAQRWFQLIKSQLSPTNVENHINAIKQQFNESGAWHREYERWKRTYIRPGTTPDEEVQYVLNWYYNNLQSISSGIDTWRDDFDPNDKISISTVTQIYNYILGKDKTFHEWLDVNKDGHINTSDITKAYNVILGNESQYF